MAKFLENLKFNICVSNIRGLRTNKFELARTLKTANTDICILQETNLNEAITDSKVSITGFNVYRADRKPRNTNQQAIFTGGGLAVFAKKKLQISDLTLESSTKFFSDKDQSENEIQVLKLYTKAKNLLIINLYIPPTSNPYTVSQLSENYQEILEWSKCNEILIVGDLNTAPGSIRETEVRKLGWQLQHHQTSPTHRSGNVLDHILSTDSLPVKIKPIDFEDCASYIGSSDHCYIMASIRCEPITEEVFTRKFW